MTRYLFLLIFIGGCGVFRPALDQTQGPRMPVALTTVNTFPSYVLAKIETDLEGREILSRFEMRVSIPSTAQLTGLKALQSYADAQQITLQSLRARRDSYCHQPNCEGLFIDDRSVITMPATIDAEYWYVASGQCTRYSFESVNPSFGFKYYLYTARETTVDCQQLK